MSANLVVTMPLKKRRTVEEVLAEATESDLKGVIVLGWSSDETLHVTSSSMTNRDALWLAEMLRDWALNVR